jgi:Ca-activated chloride channel family protein
MMVQDLDGRLNMNTRGNNTHYRQGYDTWSDSYESGASGSPSTVAAGGSALAPGFRTPARVNINTYLGGTISAATLSGNNTMPADGYRSYPVADLVIPISPASSSAQFASPRVGTGRGFSVDALDLNGRSLDIPGNNLTFTVVRPQTSIANSGFASSTPAQPSNPVGLQTQTGGYLGGVTLPGPSSSTRINAGVTHPQNPVAGFPAGQFPTFTNDHNVPFTQNSFSQTSPTTSSLIGQNEAAPSSSRAAPAPASLADTFSSDGVEPTKQNQRSFGWAVENSPGQKGILDQQLYPLMVEEQLLIESFGADHPKAKVVRKQIQVLQDMVSQHPELLAANDPRPELYRSLIEYQAVVDQFGPHDPRLNVARAKVNAMQRIIREQQESPNTEAYDAIVENPFYKPLETPLSTFSIDVDTASYSNMRRFITQGQLPPRGAVRLEELINYFTYDYPQPKGDVPFSVTTEVAACPWNAAHRLVRVGLKGREIVAEDRPASNIVFLLDVSGSMSDYNKLPLVKQGMRMLTEQLTERDRVAIVVYAGASGMVLPSTTGDHKAKIIGALDQLQAGGSTNGASGLQLAYNVASENMIKGGINRVILCTDGDFNVGVTSQDQLVSMIEEKAKTGVQLSVLGFGMGNYKDSTLEKLADKGDGNYAYIDTEREARKVLVDQLSSTLIVIAKDVKIQIEFNPARVASYRLLGYENRVMAAEDFNNDKKDAGEIGAGHTVTALYEVVPGGVQDEPPSVDPLKYQRRGQVAAGDDASNELLTLKLRYKLPGEDKSKLIETPVKDDGKSYAAASKDFKFSAAVASFGMLLRCSQYMGATNFDAVLELAREGRGNDLSGYRDEFIDLVRRTKELVK